MNIPVTASIAEAIIPFPALGFGEDFALLADEPFLLVDVFAVEPELVDLDTVLDLPPEDDADPDLPPDFAVPRTDPGELDDPLPDDPDFTEPDDLLPDEADFDELDDLPAVLFLAVDDLLEAEPPDDLAEDARDEPREPLDFELGDLDAVDFADPDFAELDFVPDDLADPDFEVVDFLVVGIIISSM
ncbi:MAG: hypothetical protein ABJB34_09860 [Acidobacteriota bacterium]